LLPSVSSLVLSGRRCGWVSGQNGWKADIHVGSCGHSRCRSDMLFPEVLVTESAVVCLFGARVLDSFVESGLAPDHATFRVLLDFLLECATTDTSQAVAVCVPVADAVRLRVTNHRRSLGGRRQSRLRKIDPAIYTFPFATVCFSHLSSLGVLCKMAPDSLFSSFPVPRCSRVCGTACRRRSSPGTGARQPLSAAKGDAHLQ
jgi:hypothetical protein